MLDPLERFLFLYQLILNCLILDMIVLVDAVFYINLCSLLGEPGIWLYLVLGK